MSRSRTHAQARVCTHAQARVCTHAQARVRTHAQARARTYARTRVRTRSRTHPRTRSRTRDRLRAAVAVTVGLVLAVSLAACGKAAQVGERVGATGHHHGALRIGLLLPENEIVRFERFDRRLIQKRVEELCPRCTVDYSSAQHDPVAQRNQIEAMITNGIDVLILDAVDTKAVRHSVIQARRANVPVVAYDRLAEGPISGYVSFDGGRVGRLQGEALLKALGPNPKNRQVVMMNGSSTDPNAAWFERGARSVLQGKVRIAKSYETVGWRPENANRNMSAAIAALGPHAIDGVLAANDGLASGVITALKTARIHPLPPVTGQDAELAAVQRIVAGQQYMSVYKPFKPEAYTAAEMAVALGHGRSLSGIAKQRVNSASARGIPAVLLNPVALTVHNIRSTVIKDGLYRVDQICTKKYADDCRKAGLIGRDGSSHDAG
ncbi:sugar ABC transporter substrate-binding protein [Streptomyces violaceusniger]|uniref:sugar ABC transporter substrate-binding protein n=1 Tax=Streptomyces violaceusniger TaxID=68280 RepID=UPI0009983316|nr:substrate-binding domain-containing protein [Streptomyces hygroscopicus]AQW49361.1 ABC transporter substrate-binding protein [Streptomyces hygroscopicus]